METQSLPSTMRIGAKRIWIQAQMLIAFHRDPKKKRRAQPYLWAPDNGRAGLRSDAKDQEAFVVLQGKDPADNVQLKLRADRVIARRDPGNGWSGVEIDELGVRVLVDGTWITIGSDGAVTRETADSTTYLEGDGAIIKITDETQIAVSADGSEILRQTSDRVEQISSRGFASRPRAERK